MLVVRLEQGHAYNSYNTDTVEPVYNSHPCDHAKWLLYRRWRLVVLAGIFIEGDLPNQVAVSKGSAVLSNAQSALY